MPSAIINGVRFEFSMDEFSQFVGKPVVLASAEPVIQDKISTEAVEVNSADFRKPENKPNSGKVIRCEAHAGKRGRIGNCPNCVREAAEDNSVEAKVEVAEEKPQNNGDKPQRNNRKGGRREFSQDDFDKWLAEHGDEPMMDKWEKRIGWMIAEGYKMTAKQRQAYSARLNREPRLNNREAHNLRTEIHRGHKRNAA